VVDLKQAAQRGWFKHSLAAMKSVAQHLVGPRHLVLKTAVLLSALVIALGFLPITYRVTAKTVIEGEVQRSMVAPFASFVVASHVRAGDVVQAGQLLCEFDNRDLLLERDRWLAEREQHARELRQSMAESDLSNVQIYDAQFRQADAQLTLAEQQLAKSKLLAPFSGIVISGDLSQLIGSPVEVGQKLFDVAPLDNYRVILEVDEGEIRHVVRDQQGGLLVSGITNAPLRFTVVNVTPVATAKDGRNYFRVEAKLDEPALTLRPGMEGIGKVEVGERRLAWVLFHSFTDWLRLGLWRWLP
jgi:multidrug efflux pump subunit AcrA (membrane-fusion protein)